MTESKDDHLSQKLEDLTARAKSIRVDAGLDPDAAPRRKTGNAAKMGLGGRIATELVVGTAVGAGIGYAIDNWLETSPWGMIIGLVLGFAGSILTIYRVVRGYDEAVGLGRAAREGGKDEASGNKDSSDGKKPS